MDKQEHVAGGTRDLIFDPIGRRAHGKAPAIAAGDLVRRVVFCATPAARAGSVSVPVRRRIVPAIHVAGAMMKLLAGVAMVRLRFDRGSI